MPRATLLGKIRIKKSLRSFLFRTPLPADKMVDIWEDCKDMRVLLGKGGLYGNVFRIKPPMCITKEDADFTLEVMRTALKKHSGNI